MKRKNLTAGFTLLEVMITGVLLTVVSLSLVGVLGSLGKTVTTSKNLTVATHLAEEQVERLKAHNFYQIMVTSSSALDTSFATPLEYDPGYYGPETITINGVDFTRLTFVEKTDTPGGTISNMGYPHPDTGLKRIHVHVKWQNKGGTWRKTTVSSLASNPAREALDKRIWGYATDSVTGNPVAGALVQARRNPGWGSVTDNTGYYSFQATDATMKFISNRYGYEEYTSPSFAIAFGDNQFDFQMVALTSVAVTGIVVYYTDHLVISQVNNKWHATNDAEYIELYNPSTHTITLTGYSLIHVDKFDAETTIPMTYISSAIPAEGYFLYLGSQFGTETSAPDLTAADAYFTALMNHGQQGGVILKDPSGNIVDRVAWGNSVQTPPVAATETTGFDNGGSPGIGQGYTLIRKALSSSTAVEMTPPAGAHVTHGNAWDLNDNANDFVSYSGAAPRNISTSYTSYGLAYGGLPGAIVSADDSISGSTTTDSNGAFSLPMAVGDWKISGASTVGMGEKDITVVSTGIASVVIVATTPPTVGFVSGTIRKYGTTPFPGILVQADPGGYQATSDSAGVYWLALPAGEAYYLNANPDFANPNWNNAVTEDAIDIEAGVIVDTIDLYIWKNSYVSGRVTTNGVDGLPGVAMVAVGQFSNGNSALTDAAGYYTIPGLRLIGNPYTIFPSLVEGQSTTPVNHSVTVSQGSNTTGIDFVITGGLVTISGAALENSVAIPSGVTVIASTATIDAANPPDITFAMRTQGDNIYQALTNNNGEYKLDVIGGQTYNLIAWYTTGSSTTPKALSVTVPSNSGSSGNDFTWP